MTIRVFIVDDHDLVREGLAAVLRHEPDMHVAGGARNAEDALVLLPSVDPDVVVVDLRLPEMSGLDLCRELAERRIRAQIVALSGFLHMETAQAAFRNGARAYVLKDVDSAELVRAIRAAANGQSTVDPQVERGRFARTSAQIHTRAVTCTPQQLTLLRWLADGKTIEELSYLCGLTRKTVHAYLRDLYRRLDVTTRAEAVSYAITRGLA